MLVDYKKEKEILSEQEAYQMICDGKGKFEYYDGNTSSIQMKLGDVSIEYQIDTKGFYQPVYVFDAEINGTKTGVLVPALK